MIFWYVIVDFYHTQNYRQKKINKKMENLTKKGKNKEICKL